jgi:hypothetical protein
MRVQKAKENVKNTAQKALEPKPKENLAIYTNSTLTELLLAQLVPSRRFWILHLFGGSGTAEWTAVGTEKSDRIRAEHNTSSTNFRTYTRAVHNRINLGDNTVQYGTGSHPTFIL